MNNDQVDSLNRITRATDQAKLGNALNELIASRNALLAKLDADTGVGDTNYGELLYLGTPNPHIPADETAPTVTAAAVNATGTTLTLTLSESMLRSADGAYPGFTLTGTVGGDLALSNPVRTANVLSFTCERAIVGETLTLDYSGGDLADVAGNALADITSGAVTNNSAYDGTAPTLSSQTVDAAGTLLTLVFSEDIASVSGNYTGFVLADSVRGALALSVPALVGDTLTFTCAQVYTTETITLNYTGTDIVDLNDNALATIVDAAVTNNSTATP